MSTISADLIPETMDRERLMSLLGVGKTKLNQVINLLIVTVPGEFDYRPYDRHFTAGHYHQLNYTVRLLRNHGRRAQTILEDEGFNGFS